ncbi:isopeptide-forming domain-containing fimbrial protein [Corynebacterium diphtheriae]|nr:isopeptide-forming domain-containing fimbrial protein [Corynebacterium diphtheriae]CAB1028052.1 isopeptide-forming domain-containing fimbrial protein [Corynebacterium diphtheriae]
MNKFSRTARSVTFAAIVGLSLGVSAPGAFALDNVEAQKSNVSIDNAASLINPNQKATLTIHKFGDPSALGERTGEAKDRENADNGTPLNGIGFRIYKILKTADGKTPIDMNTNAGLAAAAGIKATDYANIQKLIDDGVLQAVGDEKKTAQVDGQDGIVKFDIGTNHAPYLVVETDTPRATDGTEYTPAVPFIAFVPMTKNNVAQGGTEWNYDVHAVPKNYKKTPPKKTVIDQDENGKLAQAGDVVKYNIDTVIRKIDEGKRLKYYYISDTLDVNNFKVKHSNTKFEVTAGDSKLSEGKHYTVSRDEGSNAFRINFTVDGLKELKSGTKVKVVVEAVKIGEGKAAPNQAIEWEPSDPRSDLGFDEGGKPDEPKPDSGKRTEVVQTYWGELQFQKVGSDGNGLEGAEFEIYQTKPGGLCESIDMKNPGKSAFKVSAQDANIDDGKGVQESVFKSSDKGDVHVTGLHVNNFVNNAEVSDSAIDGLTTEYCLIETKAPKGKELLSKAVAFKFVEYEKTKAQVPAEVTEWKTNERGEVISVKKSEKLETVDSRAYKPVTVTVGAKGEGKVVNLDDTTPNLPMTGGAGVGILAAIGAAIIGAGAWFARRNSAEA